MGHQFQEVGSLHQNALRAGRSDPAEKGQGHGDDERAGAGDDEEGTGAVDPGGPGPREERGDDGKDHGRDNDDGRIIPGKPGDEILGVGFLFRCFLHHFQDLGDGGILKCLQGPHTEKTVSIDASGDDLVSGMDRAGHGFPGEGSRIDEALSGEDLPVHGDTFSGPDHQNVPRFHIIGVDGLHRAVFQFQIGVFRHDVHQFRDGPAGLSHRIALEPFPDLIEQHDGHSLGILAGDEGPDGGQRHQEGLIQRTPVFDSQSGFPDHIPAYQEVGDEVDQKTDPFMIEHRRQKSCFVHRHDGEKQDQCKDIDTQFFAKFCGHTIVLRIT